MKFVKIIGVGCSPHEHATRFCCRKLIKNMVRSLRSYVTAAHPLWLEEKLNETPDGGKFAVAILLHWCNANLHAYGDLECC